MKMKVQSLKENVETSLKLMDQIADALRAEIGKDLPNLRFKVIVEEYSDYLYRRETVTGDVVGDDDPVAKFHVAAKINAVIGTLHPETKKIYLGGEMTLYFRKCILDLNADKAAAIQKRILDKIDSDPVILGRLVSLETARFGRKPMANFDQYEVTGIPNAYPLAINSPLDSAYTAPVQD